MTGGASGLVMEEAMSLTDMDTVDALDRHRGVSESNSRSALHIGEVTFSKGRCNKCRRGFVCLFVILFVLVLVFAILFAIFFVKSENDANEKVCVSANCIKTAAMLLGKMDRDANPCQDFTQFTCGKFYREAILPDNDNYLDIPKNIENNNMQTMRLILQQETRTGEINYYTKMKQFYRSCMDVEKIEQIGLRPYLESVYSKEWPTLNPAWDPLTFDLDKLTARYDSFSTDNLFSYRIKSDWMKSTQNVLALGQPSLCLSINRMKAARNDSAIMACQHYYVDVAVALGANETLAHQDAKALIDFDIELAKISVPREYNKNLSLYYNPTTLDEMSKTYPPINWLQTFQTIFKPVGLHLDGNTMVINTHPSYFANLTKLLNSTEKRVIQNKYGYKYALMAVQDVTQKMRDASLKLAKHKFGIRREKPRWKQCVAEVKRAFGAGLAKQFVYKSFPKKSKTYIENMISEVQTSFHQQLEDATWMGAQTKRTAFLKLDFMKFKIGFPDKNFSDEDIDRKYQNMTVNGDAFCETRYNISHQLLLANLRKLTKAVDGSEWQAHSMEVNAMNVFEANEIRFFAGFLQPDFFSETFPRSFNYGAIGAVIGHEITHFFDDQGSQYDENGHLDNWWQPADLQQFKEKVQCFIDQYSAFQVTEISANLSGELTVGENTADNGGIKAAYRAYKKYKQSEELPLPGLGLTTDQQFFVSFAQVFCSIHTNEDLRYLVHGNVHPPGKYRVLGTLKNNEDFATAFNCPLGSSMNPVNKCVVW